MEPLSTNYTVNLPGLSLLTKGPWNDGAIRLKMTNSQTEPAGHSETPVITPETGESAA